MSNRVESLSLLEIINKISQGEIPSNENITIQLLDPLRKQLKEKSSGMSTNEEEEFLQNLSKLIGAIEKLIEKKNDGDKLQQLIDAAARVSSKVDTFAARAAGNKIEQLSREFIGNLKDCIVEVGKSQEFRTLLLEFFVLFKEVLVDIDEEVGASEKLKEGFKEGDTTSAGKEVANKLASIKDLPKDKKKEIRDKLKKLLNQLKEKSDSSQAFKKLIKIGSILNKELWDHLQSDKLDEDIKEVGDLLIDLMQSFSKGQNLKHFVGQLKKVINYFHNNNKLQKYLGEWQDFIQTNMENEKLDDKFFDEAQKLFDNGRNLFKTLQKDPLLNNVLDEATAIVEAIKSDEQLNDIKYYAGKVYESLTYKDLKGNTHLNFDLIGTMKNELVPFLMERIKQVPVPGFRLENEEFEYLEVTDLKVTLEDIIPDNIKIRTKNNTELTIDKLDNPIKSESYVRFAIDGIRPEFKDFSFNFKRRGWISIQDEGKANLKVSGSGVNILIVFDLELDSERRAMLGKHKVEITVDTINLEILDSHHMMLLNMFVTLKDPIKTGLEKALSKKIDDIGNEWAAYLNKRVLSNIPSISSITKEVTSSLNPLASVGEVLQKTTTP